jgi:hypothetical protein
MRTMKRSIQPASHASRAEQIASELAGLFDQQIEMTKREAFVGLTPAEREEYEGVILKIREAYAKLARLGADP